MRPGLKATRGNTSFVIRSERYTRDKKTEGKPLKIVYYNLIFKRKRRPKYARKSLH